MTSISIDIGTRASEVFWEKDPILALKILTNVPSLRSVESPLNTKVVYDYRCCSFNYDIQTLSHYRIFGTFDRYVSFAVLFDVAYHSIYWLIQLFSLHGKEENARLSEIGKQLVIYPIYLSVIPGGA